MKRTVLLLILTSTSALAQNGFLGKKNIVDLVATGNVPVFSGSLKEKEYTPRGTEMVQRKDLLDYGLKFNYLHYTPKGRSIGFQSSVKCFNLSIPDYFLTPNIIEGTNFSDTTFLRFQSVRYTNFYFGPSLEFTTKQGLNGVGLSYDVAVGACFSYLNNGSYAYSINEFSRENTEGWSEIDYFSTNFEWPRISSVYLQTGFKLRYPLNDRLLFYSGFHYTAMLSLKPDNFAKDYSQEDIFNNEKLYYQLQREDFFTVNLDLGISLTF